MPTSYSFGYSLFFTATGLGSDFLGSAFSFVICTNEDSSFKTNLEKRFLNENTVLNLQFKPLIVIR